MKKELFVGIDFSKATIDVSFFTSKNIELVVYQQFENNENGFDKMYQWLCQQQGHQPQDWLLCGEYTGLYSIQLSIWSSKNNLFLWLENPTQIKRSTGIKREKTDKVDSKDIALYAYRFSDKAKAYEQPTEIMVQLSDLMSFRERLLKQKNVLQVSSKELKKVQIHNVADYIDQTSAELITLLEKRINEIDRKMMHLVKQDSVLANLYDLSCSVKGIGPQITLALLVYTNGFKSFENVRQLACYCGIAPFANSSGTSLRGRPKVSHLANKKLKSLLHLGARSAVLYDEKMKAYYNRKKKEGKAENNVMNNVKNKMLHILWAVINSGNKYVPNYERGAA